MTRRSDDDEPAHASGAPVPSGRPAVGVVIPAAGSGTRMGGVKKAFLELEGVPVLLRSVRPFLARSDVRAVAVALPAEDTAVPPAWLLTDPRVRVVAGGDTRTASVRAGLAALPPECDVVVVHDGARPLVDGGVIERCIREAARGRGAVSGWPAVDTLKRVDGERRVVDTPDRRMLWHAQTPQAFPRAMLERAYEAHGSRGATSTDDASLAEAAGFEVVMVEGDPWNLKVTRQPDLDLLALVLEARS